MTPMCGNQWQVTVSENGLATLAKALLPLPGRGPAAAAERVAVKVTASQQPGRPAEARTPIPGGEIVSTFQTSWSSSANALHTFLNIRCHPLCCK